MKPFCLRELTRMVMSMLVLGNAWVLLKETYYLHGVTVVVSTVQVLNIW